MISMEVKVIKRIAKLDAINAVASVRPEDVITSTDYAEHCGISETAARHRLSAMVKQGKLNKIRFREKGRILSGWELNK